MFEKSRIGIYDYLYNLFYNVVTKNVYSMHEPEELTQDDTKGGFIVIRVGDIQDMSEFRANAYGQVRCYVEAYVPPMSRGRLDYAKYEAFEKKIEEVIENAIASGGNEDYSIQDEEILSMDTKEDSQSNNQYFLFIKSFIVTINKVEITPSHQGDLYIGLGGAQISDKEDIEALTNVQYYDKASPKGDYTITFPETLYLWVCTTGTLQGLVSSGFEIPIESAIKIGELNCYRSHNAIVQGDMKFTII